MTIENQTTIAFNDFRMFLKEDFHLLKDRDTEIELRNPQINFEELGFKRVMFTNGIIIDIVKESEFVKVFHQNF